MHEVKTINHKQHTYIYGTGGHAKVVYNSANKNGIYIDGFINDFISEEMIFMGKNVCKRDVVVAGDIIYFGFGDNLQREKLGNELSKKGVFFPNLIDADATIAKDLIIGIGCYIGAGVVVDPGCTIGNWNILNNLSCLCHDTKIGDANHICPTSVCAGDVTIGNRVWLGLGSKVIEKTTICDDVYAGAGSVIIKDIKISCKICGIPAKPMDT